MGAHGPHHGQKGGFLPIYLVDPGQMDLLYPPERLRFLDPQVVREWAQWQRERRNEGEEVGEEDALWGLKEVVGEGVYRRYHQVVAVGLYLGAPPSDALWKGILSQGDTPPLSKPDGPAIFLCPERILDWADRVETDPHLVMDKVYYHELAHALMDTGPTPYGELWGRVVEESLANWVAFDRFRGKEARWVQRIIQDQPPEYQGYAHLWDAVLSRPRLILRFGDFRYELLHTLLRFIGFLPRDFEVYGGSSWVYRAWTEAKRNGVDRRLWAVYARYLLMAAFA